MLNIAIAKLTGALTVFLTGFFLVLLVGCLGCYSRTSASGFDCTIALGTPAEKATSCNFPSDDSSTANRARRTDDAQTSNERTDAH
jgi:hypothetical protein